MKRASAHLLIFIADYINEHNQAPLYREMASALGYKYPENMSYPLAYLVGKGYVKHNGKKRGLTIVKVPRVVCPAIRASLEKAMAWEWRRDPMPSTYVKKGYNKTNPKLKAHWARLRAQRTASQGGLTNA